VGAQLVVFLSLRGIAEHLVGLVDLLEARLRRLVARVHVRVMLARELPEGLLDLLLGGAFVNAKRRVVILEFHTVLTTKVTKHATVAKPDSFSCASRYSCHRGSNSDHVVQPAYFREQLPATGAG